MHHSLTSRKDGSKENTLNRKISPMGSFRRSKNYSAITVHLFHCISYRIIGFSNTGFHFFFAYISVVQYKSIAMVMEYIRTYFL